MLVSVAASGSVSCAERAALSFQSGGRVMDVAVTVGEPVSAGDVLVALDARQSALRVEQAGAQLAAAEAQLEQLMTGPRPEEIAAAEASLRAADAQVAAAAAARDQTLAGANDAQIAAAMADLAAAQTQQRKAEDMYQRMLTCVEFTLPTGETRTICPALGTPEEQARFNLASADQALAASQARLDELLAGSPGEVARAAQANVAAAVAQRDVTQAQLDQLLAGPTDDQVSAAEAGVAQARVALHEAELALENALLRAPFDGVVASVNVTAGELATPSRPVIEIVDPTCLQVKVRVDEVDVGLLKPGQAAEIRLDAYPDSELSGSVQRVAPAAGLDGGVVYYEVVIQLDPAPVQIRADMSANATIVVEELSDVLLIPSWVVRVDRTTGQTYVERPAGQGLERVDVDLGVRHEGQVQILSGLSDGQVVVLSSSNSLLDLAQSR